MRRLASVAGIAAILAALTACAPAAGQAQTSSSPAPSEPSASPAPTPTPTPTQDPGDPATWIITDTAIGPVELEMTRDDAVTAIAAAFAEDFICGAVSFFDPVSGSSSIGLTLGTRDDGFTVGQVSVSAAEAPTARVADSPQTETGVALGSSEDEVRAAYPDAEEIVLDFDGAPRTQFQVTTDPGLMTLTMTADGTAVGGISIEVERYDPGSCM